MDNSGIGWILGPPGTEKSTTALAFALTLDWNELGYHLDSFEQIDTSCVHAFGWRFKV